MTNIGLQLYTVGEQMDDDPVGTLQTIAAIGYKEVELSPMARTPPGELQKAIHDAGLEVPSGHCLLPDLISNLQAKIELAKLFGQEYMTVTVPWVADPSRFELSASGGPMGLLGAVIHGLTLDDWKWNAEQFNRIGELVKKAGMQLAYHNHNFEFRPDGSTTGYDEFLRLTDPELVKLELDCGWITVAGHDPVEYLNRYPDRYRLLHVKDFRKGFTTRTSLMGQDAGAPIPTELGRGAVDYRRVVAAARDVKIRSMFVEQEPPFIEVPALEAIQVNYEFVRTLES